MSLSVSFSLSWGAAWPERVSFGGASTGGAFYYISGAFVKIFEKIGVQGRVEVTGGSIHNPKLIQAKQIQFAPNSPIAAWDAYTGREPFKEKHDALRSVLVINLSVGHFWVKGTSKIKTFRDFEGKVVSGGGPGSVSNDDLKNLAEVLGVKFKLNMVAYTECADMIQDNMLDGCFSIASPPLGSANELTSTYGGRIVGFTKEDIEKIITKYPNFAFGWIPPNAYKNQTETIYGPSIWIHLITHQNMPDDMIYKFLESVFANRDLLVASHKSLEYCTIENQKYLNFPIHPGAYKFYKDKGIPLQERVLPPK